MEHERHERNNTSQQNKGKMNLCVADFYAGVSKMREEMNIDVKRR